MAIGENISTVAEAYRVSFRRKYGDNPDPKTLQRDYKRQIVLLAFTMTLAFASISWGIIANSYGRLTGELEIIYYIGIVLCMFAFMHTFSKLHVIRAGMKMLTNR